MFTSLLKEDPVNLVKFGTSLKGMSTRRRDKLRVFLYVQQGMRCCFCLQKMRIVKVKSHEKQPDDLATFEHLIDEFKSSCGKDDSLHNIALSCRRCNDGRSQWRQKLANQFYIKQLGSKKAYHKATSGRTQKEIAAKLGQPRIPDIKPRIRVNPILISEVMQVA